MNSPEKERYESEAARFGQRSMFLREGQTRPRPWGDRILVILYRIVMFLRSKQCRELEWKLAGIFFGLVTVAFIVWVHY